MRLIRANSDWNDTDTLVMHQIFIISSERCVHYAMRIMAIDVLASATSSIATDVPMVNNDDLSYRKQYASTALGWHSVRRCYSATWHVVSLIMRHSTNITFKSKMAWRRTRRLLTFVVSVFRSCNITYALRLAGRVMTGFLASFTLGYLLRSSTAAQA